MNDAPAGLSVTVNGTNHQLDVPPLRRLLDVLREDLRLTGTKEGCGEGECGACTVLVDGTAINSCIVAACQVDGAEITTIEAAGHEAVQQSFLDCGGVQCGICTPGIILMTRAWLEECDRDGRAITEQAARKALAGNLCRCTGYGKVVASALASARARGLT